MSLCPGPVVGQCVNNNKKKQYYNNPGISFDIMILYLKHAYFMLISLNLTESITNCNSFTAQFHSRHTKHT